MTDLDLDQIEARANAATPGPWDVGPYGTSFTSRHVGRIILAPMIAPASFDAEFIAHAREDVPRLVAEVRRLRETVEALAQSTSDLGRDLLIEGERADRAEKQLAADHRGWMESRKSICEQRDAARAEAERLREEVEVSDGVAQMVADDRDEALGNVEAVEAELRRTEGDLAAAVAEAVRVREALAGMTETLERITTERNAFRDERNEAREALQAVRNGHRPHPAMAELLGERRIQRCAHDNYTWPCPTARALDAALDGAE